MSIIYYTRECDSCAGNHSLNKIKQVCKKEGIEFQERRTIFWDRWAEEADSIIKVNEGLKLPFYYETETGSTFKGNSLTPLEMIENWIKKCKGQHE